MTRSETFISDEFCSGREVCRGIPLTIIRIKYLMRLLFKENHKAYTVCSSLALFTSISTMVTDWLGEPSSRLPLTGAERHNHHLSLYRLYCVQGCIHTSGDPCSLQQKSSTNQCFRVSAGPVGAAGKVFFSGVM